jgi:hypothetical protein
MQKAEKRCIVPLRLILLEFRDTANYSLMMSEAAAAF